MLANGVMFSNQHAVLGRSTLKDCIVKENIFRSGLSINRKYAQTVTTTTRKDLRTLIKTRHVVMDERPGNNNENQFFFVGKESFIKVKHCYYN